MVKKTTVLALIAVFTLSVVAPVCCAHAWTGLFTHQHKASTHNHAHDHSTKCDSPVLKILSKPDRVSTSAIQKVISFDSVLNDQMITGMHLRLAVSLAQPFIFYKTGPPIHVLNSVFLN